VGNLIIGDKALFSIRLDTDGHFANASIFCEHEELGNNDEYTLLHTLISLIETKINNYDYSLAEKINHLDKESVYIYVVNGYEESTDWRESHELESIWITLNLTPCFDGEIFILLSIKQCDRVIWKKFNSKVIRESFLPPGYVLEHMRSLLNNLLKQQTKTSH